MNKLRVVVVSLLISALSGVVPAQTYQGRILGSVTDEQGAAVRAAKVVITNVETGVSRTVESSDSGDYVVPNVAPGLYTVVAEAAGFKKVERTQIRVEVAKDVRIDVAMVAGNISESVTVTLEPPPIETTNTTLGGTFSNKSINDLPLNGRDFQNLVVLRPGVQRSTGGGFLSISSNGNRPEDNNFIVDGTDNNDPYYGTTVINAEGVQGTPGTILPIDAIQEFNAQEHPSAEYGWKPGAIVNLGLKSGTNEIHGSIYAFERNSYFDARNFFNTDDEPQKALRQHQFGASVGGPIKHRKTFYFGAYEGIRALVSNSNLYTTPATVSLGGDPENSIPDAIAALSAHGIPVNPLSANLIGTGSFTGNGAFPGLFPSNNGSNPAGPTQISSGFPNLNRMDNFIVKIDHQINEKNNLTGRYFFGDSLQTEQDVTVARAEWLSTSDLNAQVLGVNWIWAPNARWVNEAKFGYNRFWQKIVTADSSKDPVATYGINAGVTDPANFGMPGIVISGFGGSAGVVLGGNPGWPLFTIPNQTFQFVDNVSYTRGEHTFRFGGEFRHGSTNNLRNRRGKGRIRFEGDGAFAGSTPLEDFLGGFPSRGDIFVGSSTRHVSINSFGAFIQDDWRVKRNLTLNLGVRYDLNGVIKEKDDLLGNFDPAVGLQQVGINIDAPYKGDHNNIAPRVGIVWDPWGKGNTVFRAGGGITYEIPILAVFLGQNGVNNATTPGLNVIPTGAIGSNINGTIVGAATTQRNLNWSVAGPIFNVQANCDPDRGGSPCDILGVRRDLRTPYVINWSFNVQQVLWPKASLQLGYVGNHGVKLYSIRDINQVNQALDDGSEQLGRPFNSKFPFLEFINFLENGYGANYNGLQATLTQRSWHGLNYVLGYTWAHAIDFVSLHRAAQPQDSNRPDLERASSDLDIRHRFTLSLSYDLPSIKSWAQLLEGWQINSIVTLQGGPPYNAVDFENDTSLTGEFSDRWNVIGNPGSIPNFSTSGPIPVERVLSQPEFGQFGNSGRNTFRAPGLKVWDFSLVKTWKATERVNLQLRAEFFNVLNHPNFANPAVLFNNDLGILDTFGLSSATPDVAGANPVIGTGGPRNIQLGLKIRF